MKQSWYDLSTHCHLYMKQNYPVYVKFFEELCFSTAGWVIHVRKDGSIWNIWYGKEQLAVVCVCAPLDFQAATCGSQAKDERMALDKKQGAVSHTQPSKQTVEHRCLTFTCPTVLFFIKYYSTTPFLAAEHIFFERRGNIILYTKRTLRGASFWMYRIFPSPNLAGGSERNKSLAQMSSELHISLQFVYIYYNQL